MRITLIGPVYPYRGGISHFNTRLAIELINAGHEVKVISFSRQYPSWLYPGKTDKDPSKEYLHVEADYILDPIYPWTWIKAFNTICAWKPELILFQWWTTFWAPAFIIISSLLKHENLPISFIIHNVLPHETHIYDYWLAKITLRYGNILIALSDNEANRIKKYFPKSVVNITQLPSYDIFSNNHNNDYHEARKVLNLPTNEPVALFFGIVRPYKGLIYALKALSIIHNRGLSINLVIAGEFWEDINYYYNLLHNLELESHVIIHNQYIPNENVSLYFTAADFLLAPYIKGTQSGVIGIAIQHGLPIITTPHLANGIDLEHTSVPIQIIPPKNEEQLAQAIEKWALNITQLRDQRSIIKTNNEWRNLVTYINEIGDSYKYF